MSQPTLQASHWLCRVIDSSMPGAAATDVAPDAPLADHWAAVCAAYGLSESALALYVAAHWKLKVADLESAHPTAAKLLPASVVRRYDLYPLRDDNRHLFIATSDPTNVDAEQAAGFASGRTPVMEIAPPRALREAIDLRYSPDKVVEHILEHVEDDVETLVHVVDDQGPAEMTPAEAEHSPIIKLSNLLLRDAVQQGASDVHIQPGPSGGVVRFRVDGVLRQYMQLPIPVLDRVVSRIKVLGRLDIANRLKPQDGRTTLSIGDRRIDLRISTVPTRDSEKAVIRLLDPVGARGLDSVAMPAPEMARLRQLLSHREGMIVVTGPTGSGKTTTLYAALRELATDDVNIMTVEDPIEYELKGMTQIQVEPKQGVTFASALRAILRQDPDIIFVGEIRDLETAEVAVQASLTGHLVLATLHTSNAVGAIRRLCDLGLDRTAVAETLRGAVAQRLVRRICAACGRSATEPPTPEAVALESAFATPRTMRVVGCAECGHTGFKGRLPVAEVFHTSSALQTLIAAGAAAPALQETVVAGGMRPLREVALERVRRGETTLDEVQRVIGDATATEAPTRETSDTPSAPTALATTASAWQAPTTSPILTPPGGAGDEIDGRKHVLVVDDEATNRSFARALLEKAGHRVTEATDGLVALERLSAESYDLMLLDLDMPRLAGYEVLTHARRQVTTSTLPVIVLTGSSNPESEVEVIEHGADDYLRKPIDPRRFLARVHAALRRAAG